jgi:hypothetical protein
MTKIAFPLILMMSPAALPIAAQIRFEAPPIGAGDPPITIQKEEYPGTVFVPERKTEYAFVRLWSYTSATSLPAWVDTKDYCERPSWVNAELIQFSTIREIDFVEPTKDEIEAIRTCDTTKSDYGRNSGSDDLRKATITLRGGQKRTVFLYTSGAFAETAGGERFSLGDTRLVSRLSLK